MNIHVGSTNPVKVSAVSTAFRLFFPEENYIVTSSAIPSLVADQPMTKEEALKGAINRALGALQTDPSINFGVGLEGGLEEIGGFWFCGGCIVVAKRNDSNNRATIGIGYTMKVHTTKIIMSLVEDGMEIGHILDKLLETTNIKHKEGHIGVMTNNLVTREKAYIDGVLSALGRFAIPELYEENELSIEL